LTKIVDGLVAANNFENCSGEEENAVQGEIRDGPAAPPTQLAEIEGERIRTDDLWGAAYEQIRREDPKLLVAYKKYLLVPKTKRDQGMSSDNTFYPADITIVPAGCYNPEGRLPLYRK
jgi:hypothetical protein